MGDWHPYLEFEHIQYSHQSQCPPQCQYFGWHWDKLPSSDFILIHNHVGAMSWGCWALGKMESKPLCSNPGNVSGPSMPCLGRHRATLLDTHVQLASLWWKTLSTHGFLLFPCPWKWCQGGASILTSYKKEGQCSDLHFLSQHTHSSCILG
jgi:hypothetical protein